ncbi:uncharacterized protein PGTG_13851 [Puccinia graminis f. sp. tritici CRL 75-36-700-3]|uniref:Uncharacterized protein n=1 Tax=Puccinia graminis f. sp. tritici (strain CRL 75-36-700-3 / race SCCL) TaxID=418459 RepID=E3KUF4_PUCGT|nr:uncharacterized protein PGTG_13851 [Puccinia graminis f. sp. tritici CRL 75-36-700-3]EFP88047.1 hypothetical protein PGTG_13851 [Puccinia graminis f. sp. tritici CRL 75-36-700-3]
MCVSGEGNEVCRPVRRQHTNDQLRQFMYRHKTGYRNKTSITKIESEPHFLENAVKTSLLAIDEENKQNWEESWRLYKNALNDFHMAHNCLSCDLSLKLSTFWRLI